MGGKSKKNSLRESQQSGASALLTKMELLLVDLLLRQMENPPGGDLSISRRCRQDPGDESTLGHRGAGPAIPCLPFTPCGVPTKLYSLWEEFPR